MLGRCLVNQTMYYLARVFEDKNANTGLGGKLRASGSMLLDSEVGPVDGAESPLGVARTLNKRDLKRLHLELISKENFK